MTGRQTHEQLFAQGEIVSPPVRACRNQSFELPTGIYIAMASMFAGFVVVLGFAFHGGQMVVAYGVIFAFIAMFFAVPSLFPRVGPQDGRRIALSWFDFANRGIGTATGQVCAREATMLVLLLPVLIMCFGIAFATIAAIT